MQRAVYLASAGPRSGKTVVLLGLMEQLAGCAGSVGCFRPIVADGEARDPILHLVEHRYGGEHDLVTGAGCTETEARELALANRYEELLTRILDRYKAVEARCEVVVCAGTDYHRSAPPFEFDFNAEVANNLGCLILPVLNGHGRTILEIREAAHGVLDSLRERDCDVLAMTVNRVATEHLVEVLRSLPRGPEVPPTYVLPETELLGMPTVGEVAESLGARWVRGGPEAQNREVRHYKVAAMELPHFLDHLEEGSLVITPGDRSDIILCSLLADRAESYPQIAGVLLTGGIEAAPQIHRLIDGLARIPVPMLAVDTDTYDTTVAVSRVEAGLSPENSRKVAAALGLFEAHVDGDDLLRRLAMPSPRRVTPLMFEYELIQRAKADPRHIVLPEGTDERILRAAEILRLRNAVEITLLGNPELVRTIIAELGLRLDDVAIVDPQNAPQREAYARTYFELRRHKGISEQMAYDAVADVSYFGTLMVYHGEADGMVSGAAHTTQQTIRPAFEIIRTTPGTSIVSSVFFMCLPDRVLVYGDCAVNPDPDARQLADIAVSSGVTARTFGIEPRIAMLSYSTGESGQGADVDKVREATRLLREAHPELKVEGPIQYDAAVDAGVARVKIPGSEVAGHASVLIFPDLNTGNNTYKAVQRSADAVAIGPILQGLKRPVNDLSRGCTVKDVLNTVAITAIQAQNARRS